MTFTLKNPARFAWIVAGTVAYFVFGGGYLSIAFLLGTVVGSLSFETRGSKRG